MVAWGAVWVAWDQLHAPQVATKSATPPSQPQNRNPAAAATDTHASAESRPREYHVAHAIHASAGALTIAAWFALIAPAFTVTVHLVG